MPTSAGTGQGRETPALTDSEAPVLLSDFAESPSDTHNE
jgi:hypothetical protein